MLVGVSRGVSHRPPGQIELFHRDTPYVDAAWETKVSLFDRPNDRLLRSIPSPRENQSADVTLRMHCPWDFAASSSTETWVFAATEWGIITSTVLQAIGVKSIAQTPVNSEVKIITPSAWSKAGLIRSGVEGDRIAVVPLGVDPHIYYPVSGDRRQLLRESFGWSNYFIFLNIGGQTDRKGIRPLLKAFAAVVDKYPDARLVLKGSELLYPSRDEIAEACRVVLNDAERARVLPRLIYTGSQLSFAQIAEIYQAADVYVSAYLAEGFNLPVLEAVACGLPVICTEGGPTDDFTRSDFALRIESKLTAVVIEGETLFMLAPEWEHLTDLMQRAIEQPGIAARARVADPGFVADNFSWGRSVDRLLEVMGGDKRSEEKSIFEPIIL
ncbi:MULTISPECIES: glycosyltransferase family 4 protein [unclassified Microcoleus]|uniref:glycosyltransferase family 4 protein n=1 Tax=unclassified Microcoleus TaxID=2642155 RepID=UPI0025EA2048|nr:MULTISPECIES: glycosyltransferase family 4 protein [unclassified Microcoleus]